MTCEFVLDSVRGWPAGMKFAAPAFSVHPSAPTSGSPQEPDERATSSIAKKAAAMVVDIVGVMLTAPPVADLQ